jgi:lipoprotein-anchoring transpeptidase ErfK/SrfK
MFNFNFLLLALSVLMLSVPANGTIIQNDKFVPYTVHAGDTLSKLVPKNQWLLVQKVNKIDIQHLPIERTIFLPRNTSVTLKNFVPVPKSIPKYTTRKTLVVYLNIQYFGAYKDGHLVFWGPISSGRKNHRTPRGHFKALWKSKNYFSKKNISMPYAVCFSNAGYFLHQQSLPGRPASHGCVRLLMSDAKMIFNWLEKGDQIIIK